MQEDKNKKRMFHEEAGRDNPDDLEAAPVGQAIGDEESLILYDNPDDIEADTEG
jgi:hypothetical protein